MTDSSGPHLREICSPKGRDGVSVLSMKMVLACRCLGAGDGVSFDAAEAPTILFWRLRELRDEPSSEPAERLQAGDPSWALGPRQRPEVSRLVVAPRRFFSHPPPPRCVLKELFTSCKTTFTEKELGWRPRQCFYTYFFSTPWQNKAEYLEELARPSR